MTQKSKVLFLLTFALILLSLFPNILAAEIIDSGTGTTIRPQENKPTIFGFTCEKETGDFAWLQEKYCLWKIGFGPGTDVNLLAELVKVIMLGIITLIVFAGLTAVVFPKGVVGRALLSILVGILATFFLTSEELITMMLSYTALGVTIGVFFPIIILVFITIFVASKGSPFGIFFQRIMWLIYSIYLFIKTAILFLLTRYYNAATGVAKDPNSLGTKTIDYFISTDPATIQQYMGSYDNIMLLILLIVSIAVFWIGFWDKGNKMLVHWLAKEKMEAEIEAQKDLTRRSQEKMKIDAKALKGEI